MTILLPKKVTQENALQLQKEGLLNSPSLRSVDCSELKDFDSTVLTVLLLRETTVLTVGHLSSDPLSRSSICHSLSLSSTRTSQTMKRPSCLGKTLVWTPGTYNIVIFQCRLCSSLCKEVAHTCCPVRYRPPAGNANRSGGGANVLRLDEDDMIHHIDDAFSAQQMVPNTTIRVDRATLRRMKNSEVN